MRKGPKLLMMGLLALAGLWAGTAQSLTSNVNVSANLATAPSGLNQLDKIITVPGAFSSGVANSSKIVDVTNSSSPNTQAIDVIDGKKQVGGFWSNDANRLDLNQDTTIKMWLYLGASKTVGDGMAFVLQNDPSGTNAAAQIKSGSIIGETLGTWGVDTNNKEQDPQAIASTAIQNSWALEFDTYVNKSTSYSDAGKGDAFDKGNKTQHVATGYPGAASQYNSESVRSIDLTGIILSTRYYFSQNHDNLKTDLSLANGNWHHLVLQWDAAAKTMTYTFDDVNPDGSETGAGFTNSTVIDTSQFNSADGLVRWGVMGATGSNTTTNMVVIESIPNTVNAKADVKVTDTTKNKTVTAGSKVKAKHKLQYDYTLTYEGGRLDWDNVEAQLKLPENVTFSGAVIKYADGTEQTVDAPEEGAKTVTYQLEKALSEANATATITLTGTADNVKINSNTTTTTSTFKNKEFETTADAPDYTITVDQPISLYILKTNYTVAKGDDVKVSGLVIAEDSEQLKNSSITIHPTLNGQELDEFQMSDDDESGYFSLTIKADQLNVGKNGLVLWASDMDDNESPEGSTTITVQSGELGFKTVAGTSTFKPITLDGKAQTTTRADDWAVVVSDERGKGSGWQLQASVGDFTTADGKKLPGQLLFKQDSKTTVLNGEGTQIDSHQTTSDTDEYNVTKDWGSDSGMFYKTNAAATPGAYSGKITWTLNNAPS
ncbi:cell surface protein [Lactiplantibacillus garii]|uniref:Cell surface protein n=1 Tax=Lactiplantibacillus garii TaxID=2306423 RepID=A0A3R8J6X3_9LACO|nr:WxL domain-containing protein [Lactiplantibacillus garii]RRK10252.1 cell surface protein [Lactiplantibacillus garii]